MTWLKRLAFMGLGASLVIVLAIGGVAVFAQSDDDADEDAGEVEEATPEAQDETLEDEDDDALPWRFQRGPAVDVDEQELLAEALGVSVEELEAAQEEVRVAAIEAALAEGLITEEEAEALIEGGFGPRVRWGVNNLIDKDEVLAEALGISVEELEEAQAEVREARLQAMVDAGVLTQEQADLMAAQQAVREYIDVEALQATLQDAYEGAVEQALEEGAISEEQAQQLQENMPAFGAFGFGGGRHHHGFGGGPQGFGDGPGGFQFGPARGNRFQGSAAGA